MQPIETRVAPQLASHAVLQQSGLMAQTCAQQLASMPAAVQVFCAVAFAQIAIGDRHDTSMTAKNRANAQSAKRIELSMLIS
jgi:hypothetical protein